MPFNNDPRVKKRVLVIDDDEATRLIIGGHLKHGGYEVIFGGTPEEGIRMAVIEKVDLIILDVFMPNITGWEVLEQLRRRQATKDTPVLMLTKASSDASTQTAFNLGANEYLTKPINQSDLLGKVSKLLR